MFCCTICGLKPSQAREARLPVGFHRFPSDPALRQVWEDFCGGPREATVRMVCSDHFVAECFRTKRTEPGQRRLLKDGAVPTLWEGVSLKVWERRMEKKEMRLEESAMTKNQIQPEPAAMEPLVKMENICRICTSETALHDLSLEENAEPARRFCSLTSIEIDGTAPWCCEVCLGQLNDAYDFVQRCIEAEVRRKSFVVLEPTVVVKQEEPEVWEEPMQELKEESSENVEEAKEDNSDNCSTDSKPETGKEPKVYTCEACEATFDNWMEKCAHVKIHGRARFPCKQCGKAFRRRYGLEVHLNTHKTGPSFFCPQCPAGFKNNDSLRRHIKGTHLGLKPFACEECDRKFAQKTQLQAHASVHMREVDVSCKLCNQTFKTSFNLRNHMSLVHDQKTPLEPFALECEVCTKVFPNKASLNQHKGSHNEPDFLCNICGNKYRTKPLLSSHLATHDPSKPFRCEQCPAVFKTSKTLKYHRLVHAGLKPFQCELCDRTFRTRRHLKTHTMSVHTKEKPHACLLCHKRFTLPFNLRLHMKVHQKNGESQSEQRLANGELN